MPIGTGIIYNVGDLILSQVSGSGTAFLETKIAAATSSIVYFDSTARINSASLNSITVGTASYVSGSTSIITNLTASNISASGTGSFGMVGIGTTAPGALLEISSSTAASLLNVKGAGGNGILFVSGSGNVGIGTTSPNVKLVVYDNKDTSTWNSSASSVISNIYIHNYASAINKPAVIELVQNDHSVVRLVGYKPDATSYWLSNFGISVRKADTNMHQVFTAQYDGNIGIGITNPVAKLQVAGNISGSSFTSSISNAVGFLGTSSWAQNVVSASFATTAQTANALNTGNSYTITNLTASGVVRAAQIAEKVVTFTPLTGSITGAPAWYRIISGSGVLDSGRVRMSANYDNSRSDIEFTYAVRNYDTDGAGAFINITRASTYNALFNAVRVIETGNLGEPYAIDVLIGNYLNNTTPGPVTCLYESQFIGAVLDTPTFVSASATGSNIVKTVYTTYTSGYPRIGPTYSDGLAVATTQGQLTVGYRGNYAYNTPSTLNYALLVSGSVGIGTTDPVAKLQVAGNVSGSSFTSSISNAVGFLGTSSWAQNVVSASYALTSSFATTSQTANALNVANTYTIAGLTSAYVDVNGSGTIPTTGIYRPSTKTLGLSADGTLIFKISNVSSPATSSIETGNFLVSGSVGIGTSSPDTKLDVRGVVQSQSYPVVNTSGTGQWVKLGILTIPQSGYTAHIRAYIHAGYNALNSQDYYLDIFFKTSNASSVDANGFAGNSWYYTRGYTTSDPSPIWVGNAAGVSATAYDLYLSLPAFTNRSHYIVEIVEGVTWANVGSLGQTYPGAGSSTVCVSSLGFTLPIGNVGIGTSTLTTKFNVYDASSGNADEVFLGTIGTDQLVGGRTAGSFGIATKSTSNGNLIFTANNGMYFRTSGSNDRMFIKNDGNVGIGTTVPGSKLHVVGSSYISVSANTSNIKFEGGGGNGLAFGTIDVTSTYASWIQSGYVLNFGLATYNLLLQPLGGNVGIGTTSPSATLTVIASNNTGSRIQLGTVSTSTFMDANKVNDFIVLTAPYGSTPASVSNGGAKWGIKMNGSIDNINIKSKTAAIYAVSEEDSGGGAGYNRKVGLALHTSGFDLDNAERVRIDSSGNVGIGTVTPAAKLEISGSSNSVLLNIKSPISGAILYVSGSGAVGIGTSNVGAYTLQVNGSFAATTKSFVIEHPTKAGKKLIYGSLESPYHGIRLTGKDTLVNGKCKIQLPDYIYKLILHDSVNIQLTGIKCNKTLYIDDINVPENYFTIAYDKAIFESYKDYDFFWDFTAIRADVPELQTEM